MAKMNKVMNPAQMSKVTQQFTQEHTKWGIKEEMSMYLTEFLLVF
jgi:division protein CdvB (Snf7/Vps24/ESCRT-III family)